MARPQQQARVAVRGLTYDAGALIAAERRNSTMLTIHKIAVDNDITPVVPAGALAQVWEGGSGRQASLAQILKKCRVEPLDESLAKKVGAARVRAAFNDMVDISVVVSAANRGDRIVTSDKSDITKIMDSLGYKAGVYRV